MSKLDNEKPLTEGLMYKPTKQHPLLRSELTTTSLDVLHDKGNQAFLQGMMHKKRFLQDENAVFCSWECVKKDVTGNCPAHMKWNKSTLVDLAAGYSVQIN
jgi:hypothetical protein